MQSTLLVGPADWDPVRMPKEEFLARTQALWRRLPSAGGAIVYGGRAHHAELAYLTHFTPKLEAALALIPRSGTPQLLVGGGVNMLPAAKPLTFIDQLAPLRNAGTAVARWAGGLSGRPALIGGAAMPHPLRREIEDSIAAASGGVEDRSADLHALIRRKSARELAAIREACATLDAAVAATARAWAAGAGASAAMLAGEHAAHRRGAQDVRTLLGDGLRPLHEAVEPADDPLQVYVAVRQFGYWAEGFAVLSGSPSASAAAAGDALRAALPLLRPGGCYSEVARAIARAVEPARLHPVCARAAGNGIGLALEEAPTIATEGDHRFEAGDVVSLRAGLVDGRGRAVIVSAMVAIGESESELLWSHAGAAP